MINDLKKKATEHQKTTKLLFPDPACKLNEKRRATDLQSNLKKGKEIQVNRGKDVKDKAGQVKNKLPKAANLSGNFLDSELHLKYPLKLDNGECPAFLHSESEIYSDPRYSYVPADRIKAAVPLLTVPFSVPQTSDGSNPFVSEHLKESFDSSCLNSVTTNNKTADFGKKAETRQ